jgi:hypothetical protein
MIEVFSPACNYHEMIARINRNIYKLQNFTMIFYDFLIAHDIDKFSYIALQ